VLRILTPKKLFFTIWLPCSNTVIYDFFDYTPIFDRYQQPIFAGSYGFPAAPLPDGEKSSLALLRRTARLRNSTFLVRYSIFPSLPPG